MYGAALVAAEPVDVEAAFRANLVVTVEELAADVDGIDSYTDAGIALQRELLLDYRLVDRVLDGDRARTLAHHDVGGQAVTIEQWQLVSAGRGYTITASCWTLDYDALADAFATTAETFVP